MSALEPTRRGMLGAIAAAPLLAAPAVAVAPVNRHGEWLRQRNIAFAHANERGISEEECARRCEPFMQLEDRIFDTPAANRAEAISKLQMLGQFYTEGNVFAHTEDERAYEIVAEVVPLLAAGGLD